MRELYGICVSCVQVGFFFLLLFCCGTYSFFKKKALKFNWKIAQMLRSHLTFTFLFLFTYYFFYDEFWIEISMEIRFPSLWYNEKCSVKAYSAASFLRMTVNMMTELNENSCFFFHTCCRSAKTNEIVFVAMNE